MNKRRLLLAPFVLAGSIVGLDQALMRYEKKPIYTGFNESQFQTAPSIFEQSRLEDIAQSKDLVPGLPEKGAMCAKYVRAIANSMIGSRFFMHHRLLSKASTNLFGIDKLPADNFGLNGDAWEMYQNIQNNGGTLLYKTEDPVGNKDQSIKFLNENAKIGDVVGFYYPDSQYNEVAKKSGAGFTHMGMVVGIEKNTNKPIIAHLFHSAYYFENEPAARYETTNNISQRLIFNGYVTPLDFNKSPKEHSYQRGDPLIFIKTVLRPRYS